MLENLLTLSFNTNQEVFVSCISGELVDSCCNFDVAVSKIPLSLVVGTTDVFAPKRVASQLPESCTRESMRFDSVRVLITLEKL